MLCNRDSQSLPIQSWNRSLDNSEAYSQVSLKHERLYACVLKWRPEPYWIY